MKKWSLMLMVTVMAIFVVACGNNNTNESKDEVVVDEGLLNVEITLPASMFVDEDLSAVEEKAKADGVDAVVQNADGSVTYKMSKAKHKEILADLEKGINETIETVKTGTDYPSVKDITTNKKYDEFTFVVDRAQYEGSMDSLSTFSIAISSLYYQLFSGISENNYKVTIHMKDESTGEVFNTIELPEDMVETQE